MGKPKRQAYEGQIRGVLWRQREAFTRLIDRISSHRR